MKIDVDKLRDKINEYDHFICKGRIHAIISELAKEETKELTFPRWMMVRCNRSKSIRRRKK